MERVSLLLLLLLSVSRGELLDNDITDQSKVSTESVNVEQPQPCPSDVYTALRDMSNKLAKHEDRIEQLQKLNREQAAELTNMKISSNAELRSLRTSAKVTENHVESLMRDREVGRVAFSAGLLASGEEAIGKFPTHTPLAFKHVISNIGNAYNPDTGRFTAPIRGAYHFELYTGTYSAKYHISGVHLMKNEQQIVLSYERFINGHSSAANGATLLLEPGDVVFPRLYLNTTIFDSQNHHSTFSGHLLFLM